MAANPNGIAQRIVDGPSSDITQALPPVGESDTGATPPSDQSKEAKPLSQDDLSKLLDERLGPLNEKVSELTQENAFLRGSFQTATQQSKTPPVQSTTAEKPKRFLESTPTDEVIKGLREDPINTLSKIIDDRLGPLVERLDNVGQRFNQSQAEQRFNSAATSDLNDLNTDYGYLRDNSEFVTAADREFNQMRADGYEPGMMHKAATKVFNRMLREGKIQPPGSAKPPNGNGSNAPTTHSTMTVARGLRDQNSHGAENSSGVGGAETNGSGDPKSIDDLVAKGWLSRVDAVAARKIADRYKVSEQQYVANYMADKRQNPRFGEQ